jgi:hypothetical protein
MEWNAHWKSNLSYLVTCQCWWYVVTSYSLEVDAFIFHREIKYDIILQCHIFYPVAEYGTLCEYKRCILSYSSLKIWFLYLFILYLLICLSGRGLTLSTNGDLTLRGWWKWWKTPVLSNKKECWPFKAAFIDSVGTKTCSLPNVLIQRVALQLRIRRIPFRISARVFVVPQSYSN